MAPVGRVLLVLGFACALYGVAASIYGGRTRQEAWVDSGRRAMYSLAVIAVIAFVILDAAFIRSDFSYNIVASGSSTTTPFFYRVAAIWATQQGSLLLWVMLLSLWSSLALFLTRRKVREIVPCAQSVLFGLAAFFIGLNVFFANPFATTSGANVPTEGAGLDPLLRHTTMMIHPPMLYSGYTLLLVPFAFAVGALISGRLNAEWIQVTRRFALASWLCLGVGVLLGMRWSYIELGWGGFWAWDPVENAALMPWLLATAYIHSIMIQEKRGMLKVWNASLVLLTGTMAIIGTFLVRSGILSSIHAFVSDPTLNIAFVSIICVMTIGSISLVYWRRGALRSEARLDSLFSREAVFLLQNLVLVALAAVIFWVTFFPLISEAITGTQVSVGPPAFLPFVVPLALTVVALAGVGPIIPWRRVTGAKLRRNFAFPVAVALATLVVLLIVPGVTDHLGAFIMFCCAGFVVGTVAQEFFRGTRARSTMAGELPPVALGRLVRRNRRRYGGYIVHLGVAVALIGIAASTSFQHISQPELRPGQSTTVDGKTFTYVKPVASATAQKITFGAVIRVTQGKQRITTTTTSAEFYPGQDPTEPIGRFFNTNDGASTESRIGLDTGLTRDLWIAIQPNTAPLNGLISQGDAKFQKAINAALTLPKAKQDTYLNDIFALRDQLIGALTQRWVNHPWPAQFKVIVSPLVSWLWLGAIIAALGGLIALWPMPPTKRRQPRTPPPSAPGARSAEPRAPVPAAPRERELIVREV
jgi:cytochrome c-type biogenesis protein CcmF